jgi:hypothetical protein
LPADLWLDGFCGAPGQGASFTSKEIQLLRQDDKSRSGRGCCPRQLARSALFFLWALIRNFSRMSGKMPEQRQARRGSDGVVSRNKGKASRDTQSAQLALMPSSPPLKSDNTAESVF